jgi:Fe2+ or Zn2+ uptake regulation protein
MTIVVDKVDGRMRDVDELSAALRADGRRVTRQRECIMRHLVDNDQHPTVESLYDAARAEMPAISLKTVYQTVHDLEALGAVRVLDLGTGSVRVDPNVEHEHHHLVCTRCGRVRDVPMVLANVAPPRAYRRDFTIDSVQVIFRGTCHECI